jgi:hypothetical protein
LLSGVWSSQRTSTLLASSAGWLMSKLGFVELKSKKALKTEQGAELTLFVEVKL